MEAIIMFGPPSIGKGTQSKLLASLPGYSHFSTGDYIRDQIKRQTPWGMKMEALGVNRGVYAPDEEMLGVVRTFLAQNNSQKAIVDGFPRTLPQVEGLEKLFESLSISPIRVVSLYANEDEYVVRFAERLIKEGREDDKPETVKIRLQTYNQKTAPLLDFYQKLGRVISINGIGDPQQIHENILRGIQK